MSNSHKTPMLKVLKELTINPHWETPSWFDAVTLAIGEAIFEVQGVHPVLARRLSLAADAATPADCQRALQNAFEAAAIDAESLPADFVSSDSLPSGRFALTSTAPPADVRCEKGLTPDCAESGTHSGATADSRS